MCDYPDDVCNRKPKYYCRICDLEYCEECAELIDGYCDCESEPNLEKIPSSKQVKKRSKDD